MRIYCLCAARGIDPAPDGGNRVSLEDPLDVDSLKTGRFVGVWLPEPPTKVERIGVIQFITTSGNKDPDPGDLPAFRHYPNVDIRRCARCGAAFALEV